MREADVQSLLPVWSGVSGVAAGPHCLVGVEVVSGMLSFLALVERVAGGGIRLPLLLFPSPGGMRADLSKQEISYNSIE